MSNNSDLAAILKACAQDLRTKEAFFRSIGCPEAAELFADCTANCNAWLESMSRNPIDPEREAEILAAIDMAETNND